MSSIVTETGRVVARVAERMGLMTEADFMRHFEEGRQEAAMTEPRDPEPIEEPDVRNDEVPEPVRETEDPADAEPTEETP